MTNISITSFQISFQITFKQVFKMIFVDVFVLQVMLVIVANAANKDGTKDTNRRSLPNIGSMVPSFRFSGYFYLLVISMMRNFPTGIPSKDG